MSLLCCPWLNRVRPTSVALASCTASPSLVLPAEAGVQPQSLRAVFRDDRLAQTPSSVRYTLKIVCVYETGNYMRNVSPSFIPSCISRSKRVGWCKSWRCHRAPVDEDFQGVIVRRILCLSDVARGTSSDLTSGFQYRENLVVCAVAPAPPPPAPEHTTSSKPNRKPPSRCWCLFFGPSMFGRTMILQGSTEEEKVSSSRCRLGDSLRPRGHDDCKGSSIVPSPCLNWP